MYTGRALKSNIEWLLVRIKRARNRSRLGRSSIIFKSLFWSSRTLLCNGFAIIQMVNIDSSDMSIPLELNSIDDFLLKSDILLNKNRLQEAKDVLDEYKDQTLSDIKWRQARILYLQSRFKKNRFEKHTLISTAYKLINDSLIKCKTNFLIYKWMAIILDAKLELDGYKLRITKFYEIRNLMEIACKLNPKDPTNWYFLGIYEFNLADLSWLHKNFLKLLTNNYNNIELLNGSYLRALQYFQNAENLKPGFYLKNLLMLGKCSIALQKLNDAKNFLKKVTNFQVINREDQYCQKEAVELLKRIGTTKCK